MKSHQEDTLNLSKCTFLAAAGVPFYPRSRQNVDKSEHWSYSLGHFSEGVDRNASCRTSLWPSYSVMLVLWVFPSEIAPHSLYSKLKLLIKMLQTLRDQKKVRSVSTIQQ